MHQSKYTSQQMTIDNPEVESEKIDRDVGGAAYEGEGVANCDLDGAIE